VVVIAGLLAAVLARHLDPARAFAFFMSAVSAGLAIAWVVDAAGLSKSLRAKPRRPYP
jgi:L-asparagine transporter-like permease